MRKYIPKWNLNYVFKLIGLFVVYFLAGKLCIDLNTTHHFIPIIWLPSGIAMALLILYGYNLWPAILVSSFAIYFSNGAGFWLALALASGNTIRTILGTYLLRKHVVLYRCFERLRDTLYFIGIVILCTAPVSALFGSLSLLFGHIIVSGQFLQALAQGWISDSLGVLVVMPLLLTTLSPTRPWNADSLSKFEIYSFIFLLIFSNIFIFWFPIAGFENLPFLYLILLLLIWGGLRFGSRGMTASVFVTSLAAMLSTVIGHGPFSNSLTENNFLSLQIFIASISVTFLIFLSIVKERKLAMRKLEEHIQELEYALKTISSADQAKNDFLAVLGHELRNPLAPVLSSIELMKSDDQKSDDTKDLINIIESHIYTISRLLNDLMDISRISRKKLNLEKEKFIIQDVIRQAIQSVNHHTEEKGHTLIVDMDEKPVEMIGDKVRVGQVIVNLLLNASKYTDPGGHILLSFSFQKDTAIIRIKDDGIGISPDMLGKIFEPFTQIRNNDSKSSGGLGIGLSLSKELVRLHGGNITAKSKGLNLGSEFIVTLPTSLPKFEDTNMSLFENNIMEKSHAPDTSSVNEIIKKTIVKKRKILVVDDNIVAAEGISELLRRKGHTVESMYESLPAVEKVRQYCPDIIILDIGMPKMNGYELARKIRQEVLGEPVLIALTGYGQEEDKKKARHAGFNFHLTKPISVEEVEKIISSL